MELAKINEFLAQKTFALVGVSSKKTKFGSTAYKELKSKNFKVFPVNLNMEEFNGDKCYPNLSSIDEKVDAAIIVTKHEQTIEIIKEAIENNIKHIWLQQGAESKKAVKLAEENGMNVISKRCILMFAEKLGFIHKCHRGISKVFGKYPK